MMHIQKPHREHLKQFTAPKECHLRVQPIQRIGGITGKLQKATSNMQYTSTELAPKGEYSLNIENMVESTKRQNREA